VLAADVAHEALARGDTSERALADYPRRLDRSYVTRNLRVFRHVPALIANPRMYSHYPEAMCRVAEDFFRADEHGHEKLAALLRKHVGKAGLINGLKDLWSAARAMFW
jgi:electron transfer flavoprotein-quinone oxidoreductase